MQDDTGLCYRIGQSVSSDISNIQLLLL